MDWLALFRPQQTAQQVEDVALEGRVAARVELSGELAALRGAFELDATEARVRYGALLTKPAGVAATVTGRIEPQPDGSLGIDDVRLKVRNLDAEGNLRTGERLRARLDAPAFDVDGWGALVPALASYAPRGSIRLDAFTLATAPLELGGAIHIDGLELALGETRGLAVRGAVIGAGDGVRTRDLVVSVGGEPIRVSASVERLGAVPRYTASPLRSRARNRGSRTR